MKQQAALQVETNLDATVKDTDPDTGATAVAMTEQTAR